MTATMGRFTTGDPISDLQMNRSYLQATADLNAVNKMLDEEKLLPQDGCIKLSTQFNSWAVEFENESLGMKSFVYDAQKKLAGLGDDYRGDRLEKERKIILDAAKRRIANQLKSYDSQITQLNTKMVLPKCLADLDPSVREMRLMEVRSFLKTKPETELLDLYKSGSDIICDAIEESPLPMMRQDWLENGVQVRQKNRFPQSWYTIKALGILHREHQLRQERFLNELGKL